MSDWDVHLVFIDGKSKKFWRARKDDTDLYVNWGRIGTDGQTQLKEFDSDAACDKEFQRLSSSKRKKGYVDEGNATEADESPTEVPKKAAKKAGPTTLKLNGGGRSMEVSLEISGSELKTVVVEKYASAGAAADALDRIKKAMEADGYR